ncbi:MULTISPECIES: PTS sugar transporter subunit IIA [Tissierellales]|nr:MULTISPECIES: PTS sugar transporter subunit IIA [Tissierellales]SCL92563.1 EIICBA-Mtl [Sporanaerobacter sp. PP17-6a]
MKDTDMIKKELIYLDTKAKNKEELLSKLSDILYEKGYVKESFKQAIIDREKIYPTGLPTLGAKVALPHTDTEHVIKPAILVSTLEKPVKFIEMGNGTTVLDVEMVFMLAVKNPSHQVKVLQKLINMFEKEDVLTSLKKCKDTNCIYNTLKREIN